MTKTTPEQQLKTFVGVRRYLFSFSDRALTEDGQKTPHNKFTFDSERDSPESEICRELGEDGRDCVRVCRSCSYLFSTEMTRLPTPAENELQTTIRVYAGSGVLLCFAVGPLADSHRMHSYTKELMVARRSTSLAMGMAPSRTMNRNVLMR